MELHPPADPPIPSDHPKYNSKTGYMDKAKAAANSAEASSIAAYFDYKGYSFASDIFATYLGNNDEGFEHN
ncbi:hypothetical protein [Nocardia huaxiensis]|uniref:hypothetical protein n=1 Tax=Nocardia huaxiensis TaxID=2755382 RepID=UPI001E4F01A9|nr:hypothetical protein [Nocardia huaxiensis]UFS97000.1 hypothetical protein LPY97_03435 [Nocardia huaxiensis]